MNISEILAEAARGGASDVFIIAGLPVSFKVSNRIERHEEKITPEQSSMLIKDMYSLGKREMGQAVLKGDDDFSFSLSGIARYRVSIFKQRGSLAAVVRVVSFDLPDPKQLGIPEAILALGDKKKGLVLVTGPAGSGKSTTLACIIDRINSTRNSHVITLEDPIEYLHRHKMGIISQREIATDTESYALALRSSLRQAPDVILLGEMRDHETISIAMTAAETGHLVISTLHTMGTTNTIDRIIDAFPPNQQQQIRVQLAMTLQAVVSQQLIPTTGGRIAPAFEIMTCNPAIRNMIRESKTQQIDTVIHSSGPEGMVSMDASILKLYEQGLISAQSAVSHSAAPELMEKKLAKLS